MSISDDGAARRGYETSDMSVRGVAAVLGGFAAVVAVAVAGIGYGLQVLSVRDRETQRAVTPEQAEVMAVPGPHLQASPTVDLAAVQAREEALLSAYAWANAAHTRARIPIARAMTLVVGRSLDPAAQRQGSQ